MKTKKFTTRTMVLTLALVVLLGVCAQAFAAYENPTFKDVPKEFWGYTYIEQAAEKGWVSGVGGGMFQPNGQVTYAQMATMLTRAFFQDELNAYNGPTNQWFLLYCNTADSLGLFKGTNFTGTQYNVAMNRYDMAQMIYRAILAKGVQVTVDYGPARESTADWSTMPPKYWPAVAVTKGAGIINGVDSKGTFSGNGNMTRAQACVVLVKLDQYLNGNGGNTGNTGNTGETEQPNVPDTPVTGERSPFAFQSGENVQQMMDRLNAEAPEYKEGYLTNGKPITEENIKEMLDAAKESMPDYTPWGPDKSTYYWTAFFGKSYAGGCNSFGAGLSDYLFGKKAPVIKHQNFNQIKVGDVIWLKDSSDGYAHVVLVTDVSRLGEGRFGYTNGNASKMVQWGFGSNMNKWSETQKAETYVYTRY